MFIYRTAVIAALAFSSILPKTACASPQTAFRRAALKAGPERLAADTPELTTGGASFTAPAGWSIETRQSLILLTPPEPDTHIAIVDSETADAGAAVAAAWAAYKPGTKRPLKLVTPRPAREGWDERQVFDYETSPN